MTAGSCPKAYATRATTVMRRMFRIAMPATPSSTVSTRERRVYSPCSPVIMLMPRKRSVCQPTQFHEMYSAMLPAPVPTYSSEPDAAEGIPSSASAPWTRCPSSGAIHWPSHASNPAAIATFVRSSPNVVKKGRIRSAIDAAATRVPIGRDAPASAPREATRAAVIAAAAATSAARAAAPARGA
jgi:hypothetical protein